MMAADEGMKAGDCMAHDEGMGASAAFRLECDLDDYSNKGGFLLSHLKWTLFKGWRELDCKDPAGKACLVVVVEAEPCDEARLMKFSNDACSYLGLPGALFIKSDGLAAIIAPDGEVQCDLGALDCGDRHAMVEALLGEGSRIRKASRLARPKFESANQEALSKFGFQKLGDPKADNFFKFIDRIK